MTTPAPLPTTGDFTHDLRAMAGGDQGARERLFEVVYLELRRMARAIASRERGLYQPTEILHEAIRRLLGAQVPVQYQDRKHFFRTVARTMRRVIIDQHKRPDNRHPVIPITSTLPGHAPSDRAQDIHDALDELAAIDPRAAEVIEYRYYMGLERNEIAEILSLSERTVTRDLQWAKLWLTARLKQS